MAFEGIKGQDIAVRMLDHELRSERLPHSLLFFGPDGSGKFTTALELVRVLSCREGHAFSSACRCPNCTAVRNLASRDLLVITKSSFKETFERWRYYGVSEENLQFFIHDLRRVTAAVADEERLQKQFESLRELLQSVEEIHAHVPEIVETVLELSRSLEGAVIGIDRIREVQRFLSLRSAEGSCRAVILDGAERMNVEASNCFLKIAEDTPGRGLIVFITTNRGQLRETVRSRCRAYRFKPLPEDLVEQIFQIRYGKSECKELAGHAGHALHDAEAPVLPSFERLAGAGEDLSRLTEAAREIAEKGHTTQFLDSLVRRLRERMPQLMQRGMGDIRNIENLLKKIEFTRVSIVRYHGNPATALIDVLLNDGPCITRYVLSEQNL
jgi:DNA polymerase III delta prime subunit